MLSQLPPLAVPKQYLYFDELPKMGSGKVAFRQIETIVSKRLSSSV
jgi:acyl-coenzyme A synthetase/AMP-(fatty) acid ligase